MRKKIVFLAFCLILFLIFTATSYGEIDPKYDKLRGDPWDEMKSPSQDGTVITYDKVTNGNIINVLVVRIGTNNFILIKNGNNHSEENFLPEPSILKKNAK